jgi:hypothetical protein
MPRRKNAAKRPLDPAALYGGPNDGSPWVYVSTPSMPDGHGFARVLLPHENPDEVFAEVQERNRIEKAHRGVLSGGKTGGQKSGTARRAKIRNALKWVELWQQKQRETARRRAGSNEGSAPSMTDGALKYLEEIAKDWYDWTEPKQKEHARRLVRRLNDERTRQIKEGTRQK